MKPREVQLVAREGVLSQIMDEWKIPTPGHRKVLELLYNETLEEMQELGLEQVEEGLQPPPATLLAEKIVDYMIEKSGYSGFELDIPDSDKPDGFAIFVYGKGIKTYMKLFPLVGEYCVGYEFPDCKSTIGLVEMVTKDDNSDYGEFELGDGEFVMTFVPVEW